MKSKIVKIADYKEVEFPLEVDLRCPEEVLQKKLNLLSRAGKQTVTPGSIEKGDVVTLAVESEIPKFNRPLVPVNVGSGMYDAGLEAALVGHKAGDTFTVEVQGTPVKVTVKTAARTVYPTPTDAMVEAFAQGKEGMENVKTVADYMTYVREEYSQETREDAVSRAIGAIISHALNASEFEIDQGEVKEMMEKELEDARRELREHGLDYDTVSDADFKRVSGLESRSAYEKMLLDSCTRHLTQILWAESLLGAPAQGEEREAGWFFEPIQKLLEEYITGKMTFIE